VTRSSSNPRTACGCPRAGRRTAEEGGQGVLLQQQRLHIAGPDRLLAVVAFDQDVGSAGVAAVVQHHPIAVPGEFLGERNEFIVAAPAARRHDDPRPAVADDPPVDVHSVDFAHGHWTASQLTGMLTLGHAPTGGSS
jgi:hypothetical protein